MAAISMGYQRAQVIDFSAPYFYDNVRYFFSEFGSSVIITVFFIY
jgi:hypothetical protein